MELIDRLAVALEELRGTLLQDQVPVILDLEAGRAMGYYIRQNKHVKVVLVIDHKQETTASFALVSQAGAWQYKVKGCMQSSEQIHRTLGQIVGDFELMHYLLGK